MIWIILLVGIGSAILGAFIGAILLEMWIMKGW